MALPWKWAGARGEVPGRRAAEGGEPRFRGLQEQRRNLVFGLERLGVVWRWGRGCSDSSAIPSFPSQPEGIPPHLHSAIGPGWKRDAGEAVTVQAGRRWTQASNLGQPGTLNSWQEPFLLLQLLLACLSHWLRSPCGLEYFPLETTSRSLNGLHWVPETLELPSQWEHGSKHVSTMAAATEPTCQNHCSPRALELMFCRF